MTVRKATPVTLFLVLTTAVLMCGCGGGGEKVSPLEQSMQVTMEGSYQVRGIEDGKTRGVGIYANGSFRIIEEDAPRMVIYNSDTQEGWLLSLTTRTYEAITYDEAVLRAGFMPELVMGPYFGLENYWNGTEFRMDTMDGRSTRAFLEGPEYLPSAWVAEAQGKPLKEIRWEYRRVGQVSPGNFQVPEGFTPQI